MVIRIRTTKRRFYDEDGDELVGQCFFPTPRSMSIVISRRHNRTVNKYAGTLLHELIHAWVNILQTKGFNPNEKIEEQFVLEAEKTIIRKFTKHFRRK